MIERKLRFETKGAAYAGIHTPERSNIPSMRGDYEIGTNT
jgi:hypothetical protein